MKAVTIAVTFLPALGNALREVVMLSYESWAGVNIQVSGWPATKGNKVSWLYFLSGDLTLDAYTALTALYLSRSLIVRQPKNWRIKSLTNWAYFARLLHPSLPTGDSGIIYLTTMHSSSPVLMANISVLLLKLLVLISITSVICALVVA